MGKKLSNEAIIIALLEHGTVKSAAAALNISTKTIYNRMKTIEFEREYSAFKDELLNNCFYKLINAVDTAIDVIIEIMEQPDAKPNTRINAAQIVLNSVVKFSQRTVEHENHTNDIF